MMREKLSNMINVIWAAAGTDETPFQYLGSKSQALRHAVNHHLAKVLIPVILLKHIKIQDLISCFAADPCEGHQIEGRSHRQIGYNRRILDEMPNSKFSLNSNKSWLSSIFQATYP